MEVPGGGSDVLLHSCCAPCSGAVLECLLASGIRPTVFFSNSNIVPREEYELRRAELERYCRSLGVEMVDDEYDHEAWLAFVLERDAGAPAERQAALAAAPERAGRCLNCFKFRLKRAAEFAAKRGIPVLTTTLASSRWKSLEQVAEAGAWACRETAGPSSSAGKPQPDRNPGHNGTPSVLFWPQNWRKGGLQERRGQIICEQNFYNQTFCGCEFSHRSV